MASLSTIRASICADGYALDPPECMCLAPFKADPDIAGPGVSKTYLHLTAS